MSLLDKWSVIFFVTHGPTPTVFWAARLSMPGEK
jgi:hypothetical protein